MRKQAVGPVIFMNHTVLTVVNMLVTMAHWIAVFVAMVMMTCALVAEEEEAATLRMQEHPFHFLNDRQAEFTRSISEYEVTVPRKVSHDGAFLSHQLPHSHPFDYAKRHRRDITEDAVHFRLLVSGEELHMTVFPSHHLVGPGFVVETRTSASSANMSEISIEKGAEDICHYHGEIRNHANSNVAISACEGLHGYLRTDTTEYFIEPLRPHEDSEEGHHPHMVYKRSAVPKEMDIVRANSHIHSDISKRHIKGTCGVTSDGHSEEKLRENWEKLQRRKRDVSSTSSHRSKRSMSVERHVETLVVVDAKMVEYYVDDNLKNYVLTIINMVSIIYHDATIGNAVNVVLVKLMILEVDEKNLKITHHADNTLKSFCQWQTTINPPNESHENHHDVAILLTRFNICSRMNEPCSTLGLSQVSGMCQPHRSCNINEDTGLALAFTVAHELGHNFGMHHDDGINCESRPKEYQHVMAPQLNAESTPLRWSNCSRDAITRFLDRDWGFCLNDEPTAPKVKMMLVPPGVMYDVNHQCRLQYGHKAQFCEGIDEVCKVLWCQVDNKCLTRLEAAAVGTICGKSDEWCYNGKCVTMNEEPEVIHGQWGQWGSWSSCSRSCGAGVSYKERHCAYPVPQNGGRYCLGERKRYRICNTDACKDQTKSFYQEQCESFNSIPYKGKLYEWIAFPTPAPCQLHCKPKNKFFSKMWADMVIDGTPCRSNSRDMCISGRCRHIGCDWVIDSNAKEDRCGICHGDGQSCKTVTEEFNKQDGKGYVEAMVIPEGARNIRVEEVAEANNYLAVRNEKGEYYLNGHWYIQWSGDYDVAGTILQYRRKGDQESFSLSGPLKEPLHVMLLFQSANPGVKFEYTVPNENATIDQRHPEFMWRYEEWTHCTSSCGGGYQRRAVICVEKEIGEVDDRYCNASTKPDDMMRSCNDYLCPARWWVGPWQHCSVSCGNNGIHRRTVLCVRSMNGVNQMALDDFECEGLEKPSESEPCHHKDPCPDQAQWTTEAWSQTCHGDPCSMQSRKVYCSNKKLGCDPKTKPEESRRCSNITCGEWQAREWSQCTQECGGGIQMRGVICVGGDHCRLDEKPAIERDCNVQPCDGTKSKSDAPGDAHNKVLKHHGMQGDQPISVETVEPGSDSQDVIPVSKESGETQQAAAERRSHHKWIPLFWGDCSKPCGLGVKQRNTMCIDITSLDEVDEKECEGIDKPLLEQPCNVQPCDAEWQTSDWTKCSVTCGEGVQTRQATCPEQGQCDLDLQPEGERRCELVKCPQWVASSWTECPVTCGVGEQQRTVRCTNETSHQGESMPGCPMENQPATRRQCNTKPCPGESLEPEGICKRDEMSYTICRVLRKRGQCQQAVIRQKCCRTCHPKMREKLGGGATS